MTVTPSPNSNHLYRDLIRKETLLQENNQRVLNVNLLPFCRDIHVMDTGSNKVVGGQRDN